ncbi:Lpg1974 family pore-forming outer membrane protein [Legionella sp. W05-934-2]|jgi:hypothetical protein|uniref:Lpg1974 family pore-forming outer membrane protein n=1 Tax=Legionella sp. W05-934-2 TaxID=1198649 RepID=UPI0034631DA7
MINFKRLTISIVVLGSSSLFAGGSYTCSPENVSVPCEFTAIDVGIQGLYVKPAYNGDFGYFGDTIVNNVLVGQDVDLDWDFGFRLEGSYHFNNGNDINLNWTYFKKTTQFRNVVFSGITINWEPKYSALNIELGQHVDYGELKNIRYHGGFQFASIETDITATVGNFRPMVDLKFNGFGPRAGLDMSYDLGYDFSVYSNFAGAILVGDGEYTGNVTAIGNNVIQLLRGSRTAIVPELEAKAGIKYNWALYQGDFIFDLGWMWINYFNAQHLGSGNNQTDFGFQGPYATVKFIGGI